MALQLVAELRGTGVHELAVEIGVGVHRLGGQWSGKGRRHCGCMGTCRCEGPHCTDRPYDLERLISWLFISLGNEDGMALQPRFLQSPHEPT
jgi:hypothetical protein